MDPNLAAQRIQSFKNKFGQKHLDLACHAAFALALTPDLLYRIWGRFQKDVMKQPIHIPWVSIADLLLSGLCQEVGHNLYEMDSTIRAQLLMILKADKRFGERRILELSDFLIDQSQRQLSSSDIDIQDFGEAQYWTALFYCQPSLAIYQITKKLRDLGLDTLDPNGEKISEIVRMSSLLETLSVSVKDEKLRPLLTYSRAMTSFFNGEEESAAQHLNTLTTDGEIVISEVSLPIPQKLQERFNQLRPLNNKNYSDQNLSGRSYKGEDLTAANFRDCDIRGVNFNNAKLIGADFRGARLGLTRFSSVTIILLSFSLLVLASITTTLTGSLLASWIFWIEKTLTGSFQLSFFFLSSIPILLGLIFIYHSVFRGRLNKYLGGASLSLISAIPLYILITYVLFTPAVIDAVNDATNVLTVTFSIIAIASVFLVSWLLSQGQTTGRRWLGFLLGVSLGIALAFFFQNRGSLTSLNIPLFISIDIFSAALFAWCLWKGSKTKSMSEIVRFFLILFMLCLGGVAISALATTSNDSLNLKLFALIMIIAITLSTLLLAPTFLSGLWSLEGGMSAIGIFITAVGISWLVIFSLFESERFDAYGFEIGTALVLPLFIAAIAWSTVMTIALTMTIMWAESSNRLISATLTLIVSITPTVVIAYYSRFFIAWFKFFVPSKTISVGIISSIIGIGFSSLIIGLGIYAGWKSLNNSVHFSAMRQFALDFVSWNGTTFRNADLTDAIFDSSWLKNADFRSAKLTRVRFSMAKQRELAYVGNTYLQNSQVIKLIDTRNGTNQNFDQLDLSGISLDGVNFSDSSLMGTHFQEADLRRANFTGAKLLNAQLENADLANACLTGASIRASDLLKANNLETVKCDYLYSQLSSTKTTSSLERIPKNQNRFFRKGEFVRWIEKYGKE